MPLNWFLSVALLEDPGNLGGHVVPCREVLPGLSLELVWFGSKCRAFHNLIFALLNFLTHLTCNLLVPFWNLIALAILFCFLVALLLRNVLFLISPKSGLHKSSTFTTKQQGSSSLWFWWLHWAHVCESGLTTWVFLGCVGVEERLCFSKKSGRNRLGNGNFSIWVICPCQNCWQLLF